MNMLNKKSLQQLADVASEYCQMIEHLDQEGGRFLEKITCLLPRLHAAMATLSNGEDACCSDDKIDLESRFELFIRLRRLLGALDTYQMVFDATLGDGQMSGSLADDLTDIYFELKRGLQMLKGEPDGLALAGRVWCGTYLMHWGQHLVDAERHLYEIQVNRSLYPGYSPHFNV